MIYDGDSIDHWLQDQDHCIKCLMIVGILDSKRSCRHCNTDMKLTKNSAETDGYCWQCNDCKRCQSLRTGTMLYKSDKTLRNWIRLIYSFVLDTTGWVGQCLSMSKEKTVTSWFRKWRQCLSKAFLDNLPHFNGDFVVEIDESAFNRKTKHGRGRRSRTRWVFGIVERGTNKVFMCAVSDRSRNTLEPIISRLCSANTTVMSDMWRAYNHLGEAGFRHEVVNHSYTFVNEDTGAHTETIEGVWGLCKTNMSQHFGVRSEDLPDFINQWCFRRNFCKKTNYKEHFTIIAKAIATYWNQ